MCVKHATGLANRPFTADPLRQRERKASPMARRAVLEFWYEFASTYSYLSAMRIEEMAAAAEVEVRWRPFLLGPIFSAQGWSSSPFNLFPAKGRYMWRDMEREGSRFGLPVKRPDPFPQNSLVAARVALLGVIGVSHPQFANPLGTNYPAVFGYFSKPDRFAQGIEDFEPLDILGKIRQLIPSRSPGRQLQCYFSGFNAGNLHINIEQV